MTHHLFLSLVFSITAAQADTFGSGANQFDINFVTIGNAGNAADTTGSPNPAGSVGYIYRIGVNEVSERMIDAYNAQSGVPFITKNIRGPNLAATHVNWNEAARFVNWLNTSKGHSAAYKFTTSGANDNIALWTNLDTGYNAANPFRNADAHYFLPSEDEWYKAAYYDPNKSGGAGYWNYATGSDNAPTVVASGTTSGTAVYSGQLPADVTIAGGLSAYGTMAQNGNVWEWGESGFPAGPNNAVDETRVRRGGDRNSAASSLSSSTRFFNSPTVDSNDTGFRVAAVPEPSGVLLTFIGMMSVMLRRRR